MAINVYLTLFKKYNAQQLKALEWRYHLLCYGVPFLIALIYCFIETQDKGKIYGSAQLWCWVSGPWAFLRLALFYAPVWICMIVAFTLYVISGKQIFRKRKELRAFRGDPSRASVDEPLGAYKKTEVSVVTEAATAHHLRPPPNCFDGPGHHHFSSDNSLSSSMVASNGGYEQFSTIINSSPPRTSIDPSARPSSIATSSYKQRYRAALEANTAAWRYTKVALLFFVSLCITWIPSSINRVYDLAHPDDVSYPLNFISALVLPLMGFWNGVIYFVTTRAVCAALFWDFVERWAPRRKTVLTARPVRTRVGRMGSARTKMKGSRARGSSASEGLMDMGQKEKTRGPNAV
ncbi:MAG: hypothetical protein Q9183_002466 [Haloplaca sp. 2 TL-2023]